jgi:ribosomal protein S18 acetylase RimI-like enzyme
MEIVVLNWDTIFFKRVVAKIQIKQNEDIDIFSALNYCRKQGFKLVYVFLSTGNTKVTSKLQQQLGTPINKKLVFVKSNINSEGFENVSDKKIELRRVNDTVIIPQLNKQLLKLAITAGSFSRFKLDEKISESEFKEMYAIWINELIANNDKNKIIIATTVIENTNIIIGFLAYKQIDRTCNIEFIAVSKDWRQKGIGKAMLKRMMEEPDSQNINQISVATQEENIGACKFYFSCGFNVNESNNIYHVHL